MEGTSLGSELFLDFGHELNLCIRQIHPALEDDADKPRYLKTYRVAAAIYRKV
jgi:hypothetical protein